MRGIYYMLAKWVEEGKKVVRKEDMVVYAGSPSTYYFWKDKLLAQGVLEPTGNKGEFLLNYDTLRKWYGDLLEILKYEQGNYAGFFKKEQKVAEGSA